MMRFYLLPKMNVRIDWRFLNPNALFLVFFSVPVVLLYIFVPSTFQVTWKGRAPYVIFIWLVLIEIFLGKHRPPSFKLLAELKQVNLRFISGLIALILPTSFVVWEYAIGGRDLVVSLGRLLGAPFPEPEWDWPLAFESLIFAIFFILSVWLLQNRNGLKRFRVSLFFIGIIAVFFLTDAFYHRGAVWFLQLFVPPIVSVAAFFLNMLGYTAATTIYADGYLLAVSKTGGYDMNLLVYWPCAGLHSLIIYTFVVLLFFENLTISTKRKISYLAVGVVGTFMVNILRIISIAITGVNTGPEAAEWFHTYHGELFFVIWIVVYLIAVFLYETRRTRHQQVEIKEKHQLPSENR